MLNVEHTQHSAGVSQVTNLIQIIHLVFRREMNPSLLMPPFLHGKAATFGSARGHWEEKEAS